MSVSFCSYYFEIRGSASTVVICDYETHVSVAVSQNSEHRTYLFQTSYVPLCLSHVILTILSHTCL
jgi:hypothetical protein